MMQITLSPLAEHELHICGTDRLESSHLTSSYAKVNFLHLRLHSCPTLSTFEVCCERCAKTSSKSLKQFKDASFTGGSTGSLTSNDHVNNFDFAAHSTNLKTMEAAADSVFSAALLSRSLAHH